MRPSRRTMLLTLLCGALVGRARAAPASIRLGVLRYGTVAWEIDTMRRHGFDAAAGISVETHEFASSPATQVALQAGAVDMIAQDWLWVTRQRSAGADWTFSPLSNAVGAVVVPAASPARSLGDLKGKRLGVAGSPLDKSWLILRAYAQRTLGLDLDQAVEKSFAAPPLLAQALAAGRLDAMLTFWPYAAKAEAAGARRLLSVEDALRALGIGPALPVVGYVFSERWAAAHPEEIEGFLSAARQARRLLGQSDAEWQVLKPATGAADEAELERLKAWYRGGIPGDGAEGPAEAAKLYRLLVETGGAALVGPAAAIAPGTFWQAGARPG